MTLLRTLLCCLLPSTLVVADEGVALVFEEDFGPGALERWSGNAAELTLEENAGPAPGSCLRIRDRGANSQAFVRLAVEPGTTYRLEVDGNRSPGNRGEWYGCAAVAANGGRGSRTTYIAQSPFIGDPDRWHRLSLEFSTPRSSVFIILTSQNADGDVTRFARLRVHRLAVAPLHVLPETDAPQKPVRAVTLAGSPSEIGAMWGRVNAQAIKHDLKEHFLEPARKREIAPEELVRRAAKFVKLAEELAPHWLPETRAVAEAAGVDPDLYLAYVGTVYRGLWAGEECTSYGISPQFTRDGGIFFHKNRDNQPKSQCAFIIATDAPGVNRFISTSDASTISCMMMVNEKGLAGSADVGGLPVETPRYRGWMNTALLRHIAERADDCDAALAIVREFVDKGWYAGGGNVGTHWLFVDAQGRILEVSNNSTRVEHEWHDNARVYFSAGRGPAVQRLRDAPAPVDFATFHNVSRDPSTCFPSSVSGMSVHIDRDRPDVLTRVWISMPARSLSFPLLMGGSATPLPLFDGSADAAGRGTGDSATAWERIEGLAFQHLALVEKQVRALLDAGADAEARQTIDEWVLATAQAHLAIISR